MKMKFSIEYRTAWGDNLYVCLRYMAADGTAKRYSLAMETADGHLWTLETAALESRRHQLTAFAYHYEVRNAEGRTVRKEWTLVERLMPFDMSRDYILVDAWRDIPLQQHLYTNAFAVTTHGLPDEQVAARSIPLFRRSILFRISAPQLRKGQSVAVCGGHPALGGWSTSRFIQMEYTGQSVWQLTVNADGLSMPFEYKYVVVDDKSHQLEHWEEGDNRSSGDVKLGEGKVLVLDGGVLRLKEADWRIAGVAVPLFALRGDRSYGTGDFADLKQLTDWAAQTGMKMIQLLPLYDTASTGQWTDAHPYNIVSAYALHPHYISLDWAGRLADGRKMTEFERRRRELEAARTYDYEAVARVKGEYLRALFEEQKDRIATDAGLQEFAASNAFWLRPYAAFTLLREAYGTTDFSQWGDMQTYSKDQVAKYLERHPVEALYVYYLQYLLHSQLAHVADYARGKGISLKGDLPVGVCRFSVETWTSPELFHLDATAGTPPDRYSLSGQNWGFPTYNWESLEKDHYLLWRKRLAHAARYFDAVRVDHVAGFFRIWEIPSHAVQATLGHYAPALSLTAGEISGAGLTFRKDFLTKPFINDRIVNRLFGIHAGFVRDNCLEKKDYGLYGLREEYATQAAIAERFAGKNDENSTWIKEGLFQLAGNVLFVADTACPDMYHPRMGAYRESVFEVLSEDEKEAYMRIYRNYFTTRNRDFWNGKAYKRLAAIFSETRMLVCTEDLGAMPPGGTDVLDSLRMLTLEIQTLPKQEGREFAPLSANPVRSVATTTTHDMSPLRLWWTENSQQAQRYYTTMLQKEGRVTRQLSPMLAEEIVARHLYCPSMLCILPLQDYLATDGQLSSRQSPTDERINVPGDAYNRWQYRMAMTIGQLAGEEQFNRKLQTMITRSKR